MNTTTVLQNPTETRRVVFAAALGTVFEWYDFFIYGSLAVFFSGLFFPKGNESAAMLASLATFGAGFVLRPFGAVFFGWLGDTVGRKKTFLITMMIMGGATAIIGFLPTYETVGWAAPAVLVSLRLLQGLAIGGEFGGAVTYIAEHTSPQRRGYMTSWLQITGTIGLLLSLTVILLLRSSMSAESFLSWGWRIPFVLSILLLAYSLFVRMSLEESPVFLAMKAHGSASQNPIKDTFGNPGTLRVMMICIVGAVAGQAVIWYTAHFYSLQFMTSTLKISSQSAYLYLTIALVLATPFFVVFGWLSDKIGRKWIMISGFLLSAVCFTPIFHGIAQYGNPALETFRVSTSVIIEGGDCREDQSFIGQLFQPKATKLCTRARSYLSTNSVPYVVHPAEGELRLVIGDTILSGFDEAATQAVLLKRGMPITANPAQVNGPMVVLLLFVLIFLATMVYGPLGAFLVEQFPAKVRYSGVSVSLQFGNGWIGGFAPFIATALAVSSGDIFHGLMYTIIVALVSAIVGSLFVRDKHHIEMSATALPNVTSSQSSASE
ncbi:MFS transporter [Pseudomonas palleroniana]|uniref:MFS transporter n=1 Tax=Pseudomonas palleroniana TaxID=191390 RepID=UPI001FD0DAE9|nr:MFS transporter [Pseudomonas palleroniana]UOP10329.1 MFS transporter [Pseudomonas palleroniana]